MASARNREGERLRHAASNQYGRMGVGSGDVVYIAYLDQRRLHLLGRLPVGELLTQEQAEERFGQPVWEASLHAVGDGGDVAVFDLIIPEDVVRSLRFERETGAVTSLAIAPDGTVNGQALQSIRRLTRESAARLDALLEEGAGDNTGAGRRLSTPQKRAVESHAMDVVRDDYERRGWAVADVSMRRPYDLLCRKGLDERHVEVKGLSGPPTRIQLTANEVDHARTCESVAFAVVSGIRVSDSEPPQATGGVLSLQDPWEIDESSLRPSTYSYLL